MRDGRTDVKADRHRDGRSETNIPTIQIIVVYSKLCSEFLNIIVESDHNSGITDDTVNGQGVACEEFI